MNDIRIVAILLIKEQYQNEFSPQLKKLVEMSREEEGCKQYELLSQNQQNPLEFIFLEHWVSTEALERHNQSSHFMEFVKFASDKIVSLDIKKLKCYSK